MLKDSHPIKRFTSFFREWITAQRNSSAPAPIDASVLEDRILYSATPLPIEGMSPDNLESSYQESSYLEPADIEAQWAMLEQAVAAELDDTYAQQDSGPDEDTFVLPPSESFEDQETRREVMFVDGSVDGVEFLVSQLQNQLFNGTQLEVVLIDSQSDGLLQVNQWLSQSDRPVDAVHFVSHGTGGAFQLGSTLIEQVTLNERQGEFSAWRQWLNSDADLLFYGCELAANDQGKQLLATLHEMTGAVTDGNSGIPAKAGLNTDLSFELSIEALDSYIEKTTGADDARSDNLINGETILDVLAPEEDISIATLPREIVFIDSSVDNYDLIVEQFGGNVEIVILDSTRDGLIQITDVLADRSGIDSIRIFSHGVDGGFQAGATWVNQFTLDFQGDILSQWRSSLSDDADILLYGCSIAATTDGQNFVDRLAELTGADVAASDGDTGHTSLGGDWELEYSTGTIETDSFTDSDLNDYLDILAITANGAATSAQSTSTTSLIWSHTVAIGTDRALFVTLAIDGVGANVNSVTYGGVALTQVGRTTGNHAVEIWRLVNPSVGTANIAVSLGASTAITGGAVTYNGVHQSNPTGTYANATGTGTTATVNVSSGSNELVLDITNWDNNPSGYSVGAGQTQSWTQTNAFHRGVTTTESGAPTVTMSSTVSVSNQWEMGAVSIKASTSTGSVTFQEGISGYSGTADTFVDQLNPATNNGAATTIQVDLDAGASDTAQTLIKFDNIFGSGSGKIPYGVTITSASLTFNVTNVSDAGASIGLYKMLTGWTEASTWNSMTAGISTDNLEASATADSILTNPSSSGLVTFTGLEATVQAWLDGTLTNDGWAIVSNSTNGWDVSSSENATAGNRPLLTVNYTIPTNKLKVSNTNDLVNGTTTSIAALIANDGGDGISLREAITAANATSGADTIEFQIGSGSQVISLSSVLPTLTEQVTLDGWTQIGFSSTPLIIIDANGVTGDGLVLTSTADNSTIRGFVIRDFVGDGIQIDSGSTGNTIEGNYIGSLGAGGTDLGATERNTGYGINLLGSGNTIGGTSAQSRNVIGGNQLSGIYINGVGATNNTLLGNYIGVDATGNAAVFNDYGININLASGTVIGNGTVGGRNVISGNTNQGILLWDADNTTIQGNYVGTNAAGTADLNGLAQEGAKSGIVAGGGTSNVLIGGTTAGQGNVISGNNWFGIEFWSGTTNSYVQGNYIGTDATGLLDLGNSMGGITMWGSGTGIVVGGGTAAHRNIISGNDWVGVSFGNAAASAKVQGNYIGLGVDGSTIIGNQAGVVVEGGSANSTIGTDWDGSNDAGERNVISGNQWGIMIQDVGTSGTMVWGNYIGTDATGLLDRGNTSDGILIQNGATGTQIGGTSTKGNIIAGNDGDGIQIDGEATDGTFIQNNYIGLAANGTTVLGNGAAGIKITGGADNTTIGGGSGLGNVIVGSGFNGIEINGASSGTTITGNYIGINAAGTVVAGNQMHGIQLINGVSNTTIGGTTAGQGNVITANGVGGTYVNGINIYSSGTGNSVVGNSIYGNVGIALDLDSDGVTANDNLDPDTGSNNLQNFPVLSTSTVNAAGTTVTASGSINTLASLTGVVLHFYATPATGDANKREGKKYLGSTTVNTDASGNATFTNVALTGYSGTVGTGELITATATYSNNTSEFSQGMVATLSTGNSAPSDIDAVSTAGGGLTINSDGGNDTILVADNGGSVFGGLTKMTIETQLSFTSGASDMTLLSYASGSVNVGNDVNVRLYGDGTLRFYINGTFVSANSFNYSSLADGNQHTLSITWDNAAGDWQVYVDGTLRDSGSGLRVGATVGGSGTLAIGNDQDRQGNSYDPNQKFSGTLYDVRVFNDVRTAAEIAASYRSTLPYDESGLVANWSFDTLSSAGVVTDSVSGNNLTVNHLTGTGFVASDPSLTLRVTENALDGTVVGSVSGIDIDREAKIASLLAADPNLRYSDETGKFYKVVNTLTNWTTAQSNAITTTLSGQAGQLATIRSANEFAFVRSIGQSAGISGGWLGAADTLVEGQWRWYEGLTAADQFANASGDPVNNGYAAFGVLEPSGGGSENHLEFDVNAGQWNDLSGASSRAYFIEWDADTVLDATNALTYSIVSQTVAGAFTINSDTGEITVADGSLLDYETNATHTITVRVSDGTATYDEAFTISLNDMAFEVQQSIPLATQNVNEDGSLTFSTGNGNAITVTDGNGSTNSQFQVYLQVDHGTLTLSQTMGLSIVGGANGSSFIVIQGTETDINAALEGMSYSPTADYNGSDTLTVTTSMGAGLEGHYSFDGGNANDQSVGISQNGTLVGNATIAVDPERGEVLSLDGDGDRVDIASNFGAPANITIAAWVNLAVADSQGATVLQMGSSLGFRLDNPSGNMVGFFNDGSQVRSLSAATTLAGSGWHHVAYTFNDATNTAVLYLDGVAIATGTFTTSINYAASSTVIGGLSVDGYDFNGQMDEVRFYSRSLSEDEIAALAADQTGTTGAVNMNVNPVNDAPNLDNSGFLTLTSITENDTSNPGNTVAQILASGGGDPITDPDSGALEGIAITSVSGSNGTWQFNTGSGWTDVGTVSSTNALLLRASDSLRFVPNGIQGDTGTVLFQAWDQTSGTAGTKVDSSISGGSTAFSDQVEAAAISVTSINDAPSGSDNTITFIEDMTYTLTATDFGFSDVDGNNFDRVWIMSLPGQGQLLFNGNPFAANNFIMKSDIDLGLLTFEPAVDGNGTGYATFDFQVQDNGGTANGGVNRDPTNNKITFNVTAQNDDPTPGHGGPYTIDEGDSLNLDASGTTDVDSGTLTYRWDLDNDGQYDDLITTSATASVSWATLSSLGIDDDGAYTIGLEVNDGSGGVVNTSTTLTINNVGPTLSASGAATVGGGVTYTLNLTDVDPGDDTISQWIVNWGDGTIDTYMGDPSSVTHVYSNDLAGLTLDITVSAIDEDGQYFQAIMLAPAYGGDYVSQFGGFSGTFLGSFAPAGDGISGHANIAIMPNGNYLVSGVDSGNILQYQPDGTLVGVFVAASAPQLNNPGGIAFGPDGNLYVADYGGGKIVRFNGTTGAYIDNFVASGLNNPLGLEFGSDGNLYVANRGSAGVLRYDGITGALDTGFNVASISGAEDLTVGPDGNIYVGSTSGVMRVNATTGAITTFIANGTGGLGLAAGLEFGPDGNLYVADQNNNVIRRYDGSTGAYIDNYASGINGPAYMEFTPDHRVTITNSNQSPTIAANTGDTVLEGSAGNVITTAMLNEGDPDDDGAELTYTITSVVTNGTLRLNGTALGLNDTFTQADIDAGLVTYDHNGSETTTDSFGFSLADGGENGSTPATGTFNITVTPVNDNAPIITSNLGGPTATINVAENTTVVTTVTATDADLPTQTLTYSIFGGADASLFAINGSTGELTFVSGRNRENHTDADLDGVYEVVVQVSDGTFSDSQAISVTITDVDEFDVGAITDSNVAANTVAENVANGTLVGITASASDGDATNNTITYSLDDDAGGRFAIDINTGVVTVADGSILNYEAATSHGITVRATSSDGSSSTQGYTINLTDVNEASVGAISDSDAAADYVLENAATGTVVGITALAVDPDGTDTVTYSLDDDAGGRFAIDANTGVVTVLDGSLIDRETAASYNITIRATSTDSSTSTSTSTITIGDVDEFDVGAITDSNVAANTVAENAANGTLVGITASASDGDATNSTITYSLDDDAGGRFAIDANTGVVTVADGSILNYEAATSHGITVRATSSDGSSSTQGYTINLTDVNEASVGAISDSDAAADYVLENAANGTVVGITALAVDPDGTDTVTYSLDDDAGGRFAIDANTGVVTVLDGSLIDRETAASYSITIRATSTDLSTSTSTSPKISIF